MDTLSQLSSENALNLALNAVLPRIYTSRADVSRPNNASGSQVGFGPRQHRLRKRPESESIAYLGLSDSSIPGGQCLLLPEACNLGRSDLNSMTKPPELSFYKDKCAPRKTVHLATHFPHRKPNMAATPRVWFSKHRSFLPTNIEGTHQVYSYRHVIWARP